MNNPIIEALLARRSCKSFSQTKVKKEDIGIILQAAANAPSARNTQAWHFLAITNQSVLKELNSLVFASLDEQVRQRIKSRCTGEPVFFYSAPAFIVVSCSNKSPYPEADCACALQNIQIAAHALKLGACWINQLTKNEDIQIKEFLHRLGMPKENTVYGCCALGYAKNPPLNIEKAANTSTFIE